MFVENTPIEPAPPKLHPARHVFGKVGITVLSLVIVAGFLGSAYLARVVLESTQMAAVITATLIDLTNGDREQEHLGTLTYNETLTQAAQAKANDMASKGYFAHTSPEGLDPWHFMHEAGYEFQYAGENLAVNFSDSEDVVSAWMDSPGHRANILNGKFTEIGIATAVGEYKGKKTTFVVQMFGTPRASGASLPVTATSPENPEEIAVAESGSESEPAEENNEVLGTGITEVPVEGAIVEPAPKEAGAPAEVVAPRYATAVETLVASPHTLLRSLYLLCALIILLALVMVTELEWKRHHMRHVVAAGALFVLMGGLFVVADWFVFTHPIIAEQAGLYLGG